MPEEKASRLPVEVLKSINERAAHLRAAAEQLTEVIQDFERYLGSIPGRVETVYYAQHPDAKTEAERAEVSLAIKLHREKDNWILSCGTHNEWWENQDPTYKIDYKTLTQAALKFKIAAVKQFPNLLEAIAKSQDRLFDEIMAAFTAYEEFKETLKPQTSNQPTSSSSKRKLIDTKGDKQYVRRDTTGRFNESDDIKPQKEGK
jgi:hypothetical protein